MTEAKTTAVTIPKEVGDEIIISFNGDDPETYTVKDGKTRVPKERAERFLSAIEGSALVDGTTDDSTKGE